MCETVLKIGYNYSLKIRELVVRNLVSLRNVLQ